MNKKNCIYIYSAFPIFNPDMMEEFENFSIQNSILLFNDLLANFIEILSDINANTDLIYCFDNDDEDHLLQNLLPTGSRVFFTSNNDLKLSFDKLNQNYFSKYDNNLLIRANTIGLSKYNIYKIFDLLKIEDDVLVVGKSDNEKISFLGFNSLDISLLEKMFSPPTGYQNFLVEAGKREFFLNTLQGGQLIEDFKSFKNLYINLSKKDSLSYCSQEMHERFTNLFIEYKDLLK